MKDFWHHVYFENTVRDYVIVLTTIVVIGVVLYGFKKTVLNRLKKWASKFDNTIYRNVIAGIENSVFPIIYTLLIYGTINYLTVPPKIMGVIKVAVWVVVMFFILKSVTIGVRHYIFGRIEEKTESEARKKQAHGLIVIINVVIWILGFVFLLDNLGYNIGTLIAGLGIGGIAIALAAQTILGDLFAYFIIYFDKPFEIGDFIIFDEKAGVVEYIGLKTTRIRTLGGEQLVCSNVDLTDSRVHNYKRMKTRRVVFSFRIILQTSAEKIRAVPVLVKNIIEQLDDVRFDRCHFMNIGQSSLDYETVYYIHSADYNVYMDIHQQILLGIFEAFEKRGITIAYPTQTLYLKEQGVNEHPDLSKEESHSI